MLLVWEGTFRSIHFSCHSKSEGLFHYHRHCEYDLFGKLSFKIERWRTQWLHNFVTAKSTSLTMGSIPVRCFNTFEVGWGQIGQLIDRDLKVKIIPPNPHCSPNLSLLLRRLALIPEDVRGCAKKKFYLFTQDSRIYLRRISFLIFQEE